MRPNFFIIFLMNLFRLQLWDTQRQLFSDGFEDLFLYRCLPFLNRGSVGEREEVHRKDDKQDDQDKYQQISERARSSLLLHLIWL